MILHSNSVHCEKSDSKQKRISKAVKRDAKMLAIIYVKSLRLIKIGTEASIKALNEYRKKRRRRYENIDFVIQLTIHVECEYQIMN